VEKSAIHILEKRLLLGLSKREEYFGKRETKIQNIIIYATAFFFSNSVFATSKP
jgi:hypothetical protein